MRVAAVLLAALFATGALAAHQIIRPAKTAAMTMSGEACTIGPLTGVSAEPGLPERLQATCGGHVAATLAYASLNGNGAPDRAQIARRFTESRRSSELQQSMLCREAQWIDGFGSQGVPIMAVPCVLRDGGWPHLVLVEVDDGRLAIADGAAGSLPVLLALLRSPGAADAREQQVALLRTIWGSPILPASAGDVARLNVALRGGRTANGMGKFAEAEAAFREALDLQTGTLKANDETVAATLLDLALNVSNQGRAEEAAALFRRAAPLLQTSNTEALGARRATYLGLDAANRGDFVSGLAYAREATDLWRKMLAAQQSQTVTAAGSTGNGIAEQGELANALNLQARMELRTDNGLQAYASASQALLILNKETTLPPWWRADSLLALGEISIAQGRLSAAETYLNAALKLRRQLFGDGPATIRVLAALGRAYQREGMNTSAIITYREMFRLARAMPSTAGLFDTEMLLPFAAALVGTAQTLTNPTERRGLYAEAFDAFQLVQSPIVDKTIAQAAARLAAVDADSAALMASLQQHQRDFDLLHVRLAHEQSLPDNERSGRVEAALRTELSAASAGVITARRALTLKLPDYDSLVSPPKLGLDRLRAALRPGEGVLSFLVGRDQSFAQLVTRDGAVIAPVSAGAADLRQAVTALRRPLEVQGGAIGEFNIGESNRLHDLLLAGLKSPLANVDRLIVIPSGSLANLPFALLVASPSPEGRYASADWLIRSRTVSYSPSLQALSTLRTARPRIEPKRALLAFGNPTFTGSTGIKARAGALSRIADNCRDGGPMPASLLTGLAPLPDTARELAVVARSLNAAGSDVFLGRNATEASLRSQTLSDVRILYFATHGLLPGELKCQAEPGLVLSPPGFAAADRSQDGLLESSEIAALRLNADLVVLSACNTAAGDNRFGGGEALSGLAEAFFHAGARNMLVSHWQVPSAATSELMSTLFASWQANGNRDVGDSLRFAQRKLIAQEQTAHPFFWAAFVVVGDGMGQGVPNPAAAQVAR